jgi:hypothetical protein
MRLGHLYNYFQALLMVTSVACATGGTPEASPTDSDGGVALGPDAAAGTPDSGGGPSSPDAAAASCTLSPQTGCAPGKACDLGPNNTPECRDVTAPGNELSTCAGSTTCAAGYVCIGTPGACRRYCTSDGDCGTATDGALCIVNVIDDNQQPIAGAKLCTQDCDPVTGSRCPSGFSCHVYRESAGAMRPLTACDAAGAGTQNAACTDNRSCAVGYDCYSVTPAGGGTPTKKCLHNCNATANTGCAGTGGVCQGTGRVIGGIEYGGCL